MKKIVNTIVLVLFMTSCKNNKQEVVSMVSGTNYKYWDVLDLKSDSKKNTPIGSPFWSCYYFSTTGEFKIFSYRNGKRVLYDGGDVVVPGIWSYLSDSTIMIATANYKIKKLSNDTLIYYHPKFGEKILVKSKVQDTSLDTIRPPDTTDYVR